MRIPELDPKTFYMVGKYAFGANALIGLIRVVDLWTQLKSYEIFSSLASTTFYFVLAWFFSTLQSKEVVQELNSSDIFKMNEALSKLELEGGEVNGENKSVPVRHKKKSGKTSSRRS